MKVKFLDVVENTYRKNARFSAFHDIVENKRVTAILSMMLMKIKEKVQLDTRQSKL